ncbi:UNVERIFIED_CONTAM: FG-GAP-like repeat-containing protein [Microbacterium sp. SLM126]
MRARITAVLLTLSIVTAATVVTAAPAQAATGTSATVFSLTNAHRANVGLKPLISDPALDRAALAWARHLAATCTFSHSSATWRAGRVSAAGWSATGENIAAGYATPNAVMSAWMASSGHRANILNSRYTGVGIGFATGKCYQTYWVQIFGMAKTAAPASAGDSDGDLLADVVVRDSQGQVILQRGNGTGGWRGSSVVGSGWLADDKLLALGDFTGDGINDLARVRGTGSVELLRGTGSGTYAAPTAIGTLWPGYRHLIGGLDFNGDRRTDIIGVTPAGTILLHTGTGKGQFAATGVRIGAGWSQVTAAFYAGDFNGDTRGDILTRTSDGRLFVNTTTGTGGWGKAAVIGSGWNAMTAVFSPGDFDASGKPDVLARRTDGTVVLYRGNGRGGWASISNVGTGWNAFNGFG